MTNIEFIKENHKTMTAMEIATERSIGYETVMKYCSRMCIKTKPARLTYDAFIKEHHSHMTTKEMASALGASKDTVYSCLSRLGLKSVPEKKPKEVVAFANDEYELPKYRKPNNSTTMFNVHQYENWIV
jgi:DNA-binding CsgD family transcriptional regulator